MRQGHADVPRHGGVGKVPLQPADRQLCRQVFEDRVRQAKVALGVLEINGVHLVGHGARTHFACNNFLLEILHRHIHPHIAAQIQQYRVNPLDGVESGSHVVVMFDLRRVLLPLQAQAARTEFVGEGAPIDVRKGHEMCVHVTRGTAEFARVRDLSQQLQLRLQALDEDLELLGEIRGRRWLPVGLRQHGHVPFGQALPQGSQDALHRGHVGVLQSVLDHQRRRRVVDVLAGQGEMHPLFVLLQAELVELLLDEVLNRLDVVVRDLFSGLDGACLLDGEAVDHGPQLRGRVRGQVAARRHLPHERDEVLDLDVHAVPDEAELREVLRQALGVLPVSAVDRPDGR
mmetsp:Transcript_15977/g.47439  ORF Transcript_15977/g.47439 Transcript_15977/m.47439 type:complete len:344 (-) Transcript_15977:190-1221(-)